jgi:hypothetical protein
VVALAVLSGYRRDAGGQTLGTLVGVQYLCREDRRRQEEGEDAVSQP